MKKALILTSAIVLIISTGLIVVVNPLFFNKKEDNSVAGDELRVNKERLYLDVEKLTSINPPRNYNNVESLDKAAEHIFTEFDKLDCSIERQYFPVGDKEYQNVICSFGDEKAKRIVIGAHYDVDGDQPGADDNASAVAGLLELARLINVNKPNLDYRIDFVAYSLEEMPHFKTENMGSAVHAKSLKEENAEVELMICLEMIGYFTEEENSQKYPTSLMKTVYPNRGNFIAVVSKLGQGSITRKVKREMIANSDIEVYSINAPTNLPGIDFSDHQSYWKEGYNAVMVTDTSFFRNPNYHKQTDTIDTLNFDKMAQVVEGIYGAVINY